jgi:hypothetical protein
MNARRAYPIATVGFVAREKFNLAGQALAALIDHATIPFNLIIVDGNIPPRYRAEMDRVLASNPGINARIIRIGRYLQPNESKNIVVRESTDEYIALVENDSFVPPRWLPDLLDACFEYPDGCMVFPEMFEGPVENGVPHVDPGIGGIRRWTQDGRIVREIFHDESVHTRYLDPRRQVVGASEAHVFLFPRAVSDRIGGLDERLTTREHCDLSLRLHEAGVPMVLDGNVRASFYPAPPIHRDELPFFRLVWNVRAAAETTDYLLRKWNLVSLPGSIGFVRAQAFRVHPLLWRMFEITRRRVPAFARHFRNDAMTLSSRDSAAG